MRFLLSRLDVDTDFSTFHFDVNVDKKPDFDQAINGTSFSSVA